MVSLSIITIVINYLSHYHDIDEIIFIDKKLLRSISALTVSIFVNLVPRAFSHIGTETNMTKGLRDEVAFSYISHPRGTQHMHTGGQSKKFSSNPKISVRLHCNPKTSAHFIFG